MNDEQLAAQIRADRIDILFDLAGHTARNRLLVFARKPAPIQITWIGYEGTTGLEAMDYILADRYTIPAGSESLLSGAGAADARRLRLLRSARSAAGAGPAARAAKRLVRFGSFNNLAKINAPGGRGLGEGARARAALPAGAEVSRAGRRRRSASVTWACSRPWAWTRRGWSSTPPSAMPNTWRPTGRSTSRSIRFRSAAA